MASKYASAEDRRTEPWQVYLQACQCACGHVELAWDTHDYSQHCPGCGSDDEAASVMELEADVGLDHYGEPDGPIVMRHGYEHACPFGDVEPDLPDELEEWLIQRACEERECCRGVRR